MRALEPPRVGRWERIDTRKWRPWGPTVVTLNGTPATEVVRAVALWNGGPGFIVQPLYFDGVMCTKGPKGAEIATRRRFGLVRISLKETRK